MTQSAEVWTCIRSKCEDLKKSKVPNSYSILEKLFTDIYELEGIRCSRRQSYELQDVSEVERVKISFISSHGFPELQKKLLHPRNLGSIVTYRDLMGFQYLDVAEELLCLTFSDNSWRGYGTYHRCDRFYVGVLDEIKEDVMKVLNANWGLGCPNFDVASYESMKNLIS